MSQLALNLSRLAGLSPRSLYLRQRSRRHKRMAIATIDTESLFALRKGAAARSLAIMDLKYFDLDFWIEENLYRFFDLELQKHMGRRLLDIGTGFGYFPYICRYFGVPAEGLDRHGHQIYDEVCAVLGVKKRNFTIQPNKPLPRYDHRFSVITAYQIGFNQSPAGGLWSPENWEYFLEDVFENLLAPEGLLYLKLNYAFRRGEFIDPEVAKVFDRYGGDRRFGTVRLRKR